MAYTFTNSFRPQIDALISLATTKGYVNQTFTIGSYRLLVSFNQEIKVDYSKVFPTLETYIISNTDDKVRYEIYGYRTDDKGLIIVELNKWQQDQNTFLLNNQLDSPLSQTVLNEITEIIAKLVNTPN